MISSALDAGPLGGQHRHKGNFPTNKTMTTEQIIETVYATVPYPAQIYELQIEDKAIRFKWRNQHFRVTDSLFVETVGDGVLIGDDASILLSAFLKAQHSIRF